MRLPGFIRRHWKLKVGCCLIAFVTWVGVVYAGNPPETKVISLLVPQNAANIPAGYVLVHPVNNVLVRVGGDQNTLDSLNPAVLTANVDWAAVNRAGTYSIPISITNTDPNIELIGPPTSVQVDVDALKSTSVPVTIQFTSPPPVGYRSVSEQVTPSTVAVIGPQHELTAIVASVTVNLSTQKANFQASLPVLIDSKGVRLNNVNVDPNVVSVSITITADVTSRTVAVAPKIEGTPSPGRYLAGFTVSPFTVTITGPQSLLNGIQSIPTTPIFLNGIFGSSTQTLTLVLPAGVTAPFSKVTVTIQMVGLPTPAPTSPLAPTPTPTPVPT